MRMLRGLRLNCLLVPTVQVVLGLATMVWLIWHAEDGALDRACAAAGTELALVARLPDPDPHDLRAAAPRWRYAAVIAWSGEAGDETVRVLTAAGERKVLDSASPAPELIEGFYEASSRAVTDRIVVAAPLPTIGEEQRLLYGERDPPPTLLGRRVWLGLGLYLLVGMTLAVYLARHVYLPVRAISAHARATLEGGADESAAVLTSPETEELRSTVDMLSRRSREKVAVRHGDAEHP